MAQPRVVMVGGGKGGVGKSSVTAGLSRQLAGSGLRVGVLDADLSGPSQGLLFPCGPMPVIDGQIRPARYGERIRVGCVGLIAAPDSALVWSDATAAGMLQLLTAPEVWDEEDVLVIDLPPGQGRVTSDLAVRYPEAVAVLVTTGSPLAIEECARSATFLRRMELGVAGIVENMAYTACAACHHEQPLFGAEAARELARTLGVPLLARLAFGGAVARGDGMSAVAEVVRMSAVADVVRAGVPAEALAGR